MTRRRGRRGTVGGAAPFPTIADTNTSTEESNTTSHTVSLPANIASGNLLLAIFCVDSNPTTTFPGGWTIFRNLVDGAFSSRTVIAYREADGGEGASITVTTAGGGQKSAHASLRFTGIADPDIQAPEASTGATSTSANPDPDSVTPTGGAKNYVFIAIEGNDDGRNEVTAYPTNYDLVQLNPFVDFADGVSLGVSARELDAASEDPGTYTIAASDGWVAFTVAVHPA